MKYIVKKAEIDSMEGLRKQHFLNPNAERVNKSLGDLTGLTGLGVHIIEVQPGKETTEVHVHYHEDECVYVLEGGGLAIIGDEKFRIEAGDFVGYRAGGEAHGIINDNDTVLRCLVIGQRLNQDVGDYPQKKKRIYRNQGLPWDVVEIDNLVHPQAGKK